MTPSGVEQSIATRTAATQIPANFTSATFASAGVFAIPALANAPAGGGGGSGVTLSQLNTALASGITTLAANGVDLSPVETGINMRQALSPVLAAAAGVVGGAGTGVIVIKGGNVATTRITATTDNAGNRFSVTLAIPA
jgi:hypothetical protein